MEDRNSPEAVAARANQEDPIIMYLIVRTSLEMSPGKLAAQVGHAVDMLRLKYQQIEKSLDWVAIAHGDADKEQAELCRLYRKWDDTSFRKVVLAGKDKDWSKIKEEFKDNMVLVIDAGLTEIEPGSETVIGLFPMFKTQAPKVIKKLQVLK